MHSKGVLVRKSIKTLGLSLAAVAAFALVGCFGDNNPTASDKNAPAGTLVVSMGVKDVDNLTKRGLAKGQTITLKKLIIKLESSVGSDPVINDTIIAKDTVGSIFKTDSRTAQQILKTYSIRPLRNWTITVETRDSKDSTIHKATATANSIAIGEVRPVTLNLSSKYVMYAAKFTLPDSIASTASGFKQKLYVKRFRMTVDGITVRDTTLSYFIPDSTHLVQYDYVRSDTAHTIGLYVYADSLGSWNSAYPVYGDTIHITSTDTTYSPVLPWTGPGSPNPSDPTVAPGNGAQAALTIEIGAVGLVTLNTGVDGTPLPKVLRKKK